MELDSVKPSEYVMELTGNHRRRQAAASARGKGTKGSKSAAPSAATGAASKTAKTRPRQATVAPLVAEPVFVPDPDVIYTATGVKSLKKGKDANEDQVSYYKTLLDELYKHQTGRQRDDQKKKDKEESAALASYVTLPRSWRHFDDEQKASAAAAAAEAEHKRRPDERLITVSDLPYGDGSKLLRYSTLDDIKSRHTNAPSGATLSSYASPRSWSMVDFVGGDEELLSYLYNEPEASAETQYRRDVIRPLERRPEYRTTDSSYMEQLLGRQRSVQNVSCTVDIR